MKAVAAAARAHPCPTLAAVALVLDGSGGVVALLCRVPPLCRPGPGGDELRRRSVHVLLGVVTLWFPLWFDRVWPVALLAAIVVALLLMLRIERLRSGPLGRLLHRFERVSAGELLFPLSAA